MAILVFVAGASVVLAHASLVRSVPAANAVLDSTPSELRLWFAEAPEPDFSAVGLLNRDGQQVDALGTLYADPDDPTLLVASLKPLPPGVYTVAWHTFSANDGHHLTGSFVFVIGRDQAPPEGIRPTPERASVGTTGSPTVPGVVTHWLAYLGAALLTGGFTFVLFNLRPALADATTVKRRKPTNSTRRAPTSMDSEPSTLSRALFNVLGVGWLVSVIAILADALLQAGASSGTAPPAALGSPLVALLSGTRYGTLLWLRLVMLVILGVLLVVGHSRVRRHIVTPRWWWTGLGLCGFMLLAISLSSHAAAGQDPILAIAADWLHLMSASVWVGGLVSLLIVLPRLRKVEGVRPAVAISRLVGSFSQVATVCVIILCVTGVYRAIFEIADWENLFDTSYGTALLTKLGLMVPLLGLAALNLFLNKRRLTKAAGMPEPDTAIQPWYRGLRQAVGGEVLFVSALLLVTSVLTSLLPAREAFGTGLVVRGQAADLRLVLVISPGQYGLNSFDAYLRDRSGQPVTAAEKVALIFTMVEHDMGDNEAVADNVGGGHYLVQGGYISMVGTWHIQVLMRRQGQDDVRIPLVVHPRGVAIFG